MTFSIHPSTAACQRDGLFLAGGAPGAVVLLGTEEREVTLTATPGPAPDSRSRLTPLGAAEDHVSEWSFINGFRLEWHVTRLLHWPGFSARTVFTNNSPTPVRLRRLGILQADAPALKADAADWFVTSPFQGWRNPGEGPLVGFTGDARVFPDAVSIYSRQGERGLFVAAVGPAESDVKITLTSAQGGHGLAVHSDMTDIVIDPGETRTSEEVLFLFAPHREAYDAVLRWLAATHGSRTHRGAFTGWCSWYEQYSNVSAAHVQAVAAAVRANRDTIPQAVIQIDEGYQRKWGDWRTNEKFPEGWKPVVEAIRSAGAIPGVWMAPLGVFDSTGVLEQHPDWFQLQAGAWEPSGGLWREGTLHHLDPTHPGAREFIRAMIRNAKAEGFRYFKIDFNQVISARFHDPKATRFQALRQLYQLYREEMGEDVYLNSCIAALNRAVLGLVDAMRTGGDSDYHWTGGCGILDAICATGHTAPVNGILAAADPDVFYIRRRSGVYPLTTEQLQSWQGFVGLLGGVTMTSEPLHRPEYADAFRELEICTPPVPERGASFLPGMELYPSLFGFVAERTWGCFAAVQLFNARETAGDVALDAPTLNALGECHVWSFRDGVYLGRVSGRHVEASLPPWGSRIVRMTPVSTEGRPVLIGSDLHIGMGAAEIRTWSASSDTVEIILTDAGARSGALWIYSEKPVALETATRCSAIVERTEQNTWRIRISGRERGAGQVLRLAVGRPIAKDCHLAGRPDATPVTLRFTTNSLPGFGIQGLSAVEGSLTLSVANTAGARATGEIMLSSRDEGDVKLTPARCRYDLKPGEAVSHTIAVTPLRHAANVAVAARNVGPARGAAWAFLSMAPLSLGIPAAADTPSALRSTAESMGALRLPGEPPVAELRLAASPRQLFMDIHVFDAHPAPNADVFWQGSCVEVFGAMPNSPKLRQLYFVPDPALTTAAAGAILFERGELAGPCPEIATELTRDPDGYRLRAAIPFERLGLPTGTAEFLLDFQISRHLKGALEHVPLLGSPGACRSNKRYARVSVSGV